MIIDTSNALCGPGFLPGPRLSEGRSLIDRGLRVPRLERRRGGSPPRLRPPKCRPPRVASPSGLLGPFLPLPPLRGGESGASSARGPEVLLSAAAGGSEPPPLPARWGPPTLAAGGRRRGGRCAGGPGARVAAPSANSFASGQPPSGERPPRPHPVTTSGQARQPAEFKHITKRRKRN